MNGFSLWGYEMRAALRRPAPLFLSFFIPLLLLGLVLLSVYSLIPQNEENIQAAIVDFDQTFETKALVNQLSEDDEMKKALTLLPMSSGKADEQFSNGLLAGIITIPKGFSESLRIGENEPIQVVTNEEQPLSANMLKLLLDSGAMYISASQSAVNTVYDLHIKELSDSGERSQKLQQAILTLTLFALSRNDAFSQEELRSGSRIGWKAHGLLAVLLTVISSFALLFHWFDSKHAPSSMLLRLRSYHITQVQLFRVQWGKWFFLISIIGCVYWGLATWWSNLLSAESTLIILLMAAFLASLIACCRSLITHIGLRMIALLLVTFLGLGAGGVWVPSLYLPEYLSSAAWNPFGILYSLYSENMMGEDFSRVLLVKIIVWTLLLFVAGLLFALRKERRHAYVSYFKRS
ncbi:ABC transporter permease [Pontibacillus sp. HMF3514]|uniref:ABC transporter permease n=1 Tax=Pontibacillus sp. HMF3514 TaxID=2692425 RepID=UPI0013201985|nr:ABC transporter permease [Pontibacillus sp. HMF3514]QHE51221.1 ABC transporter permease [Pontibacillus sp. HMF3514]